MDFKTLLYVSIGVFILAALIFLIIFKTNEGYKSDKTNAMFNNSPKFWNWKNIKSHV